MTGGCFEAAKASRHHREINEILPEVLHSGDDEVHVMFICHAKISTTTYTPKAASLSYCAFN